MRGTSRASLQSARDRFEPVLAAAGVQARVLGEELFTLVDALDSSASLRRTLADPSVDADAKAGLATRLLVAADPRTVDLVQGLVRSRWSVDIDLDDAVEELAFHAVLASAETDGGLEKVEQELFRITRALAGQRELRRGLFEPRLSPAARVALVDGLLGGQGTPATRIVARRAAAAPRGRRYVATLGHVGDLVADRRSRQVATVTSARDLTAGQRQRLLDVLSQTYGRAIQLNVIVDEYVIGGLRIQVGPDVIDSTVLARLADARRRLAG
jgi:F-type H+-transporting ATPase subunit delta